MLLYNLHCIIYKIHISDNETGQISEYFTETNTADTNNVCIWQWKLSPIAPISPVLKVRENLFI